jgi:hypothetical protein
MHPTHTKFAPPLILSRLVSSLLTFLSAALLLAACASTPAPTEQMALSRAAVSNATSAGGNEYAPVQLKSAVDKMDAAERAMSAKDYVRRPGSRSHCPLCPGQESRRRCTRRQPHPAPGNRPQDHHPLIHRSLHTLWSLSCKKNYSSP